MTDRSHKIFVCTSCREVGSQERPGYEILEKLRSALAAGSEALADAFDVFPVECMAGCSRPCTVGFRADNKAAYVFGDINPETDISDLVAFAGQFHGLEDGWCSSTERPGKLRRTTLARIPAGMISAGLEKAGAS